MRPILARLIVIAIAMASTSSFAADNPDRWVFSQFQWENDDIFPIPYSEPGDRFYTNGLRISFSKTNAVGGDGLPFWAAWARNWCLLDQSCVNPSFAIGQNFFTPEIIEELGPQPFDRPWAGWLYGGQAFTITPTRYVQHTLELQVGLTGPAAGSKFIQTKWHELIGSPTPAGWGNQFDSELGLNFFYGYQRILGRPGKNIAYWDFVPSARLAIGNVTTYGGIGGTLRIGKNISGFPYDPIRPTDDTVSVREAFGPSSADQEWEYYFFVGGEARYIAHNYFLEGSLFRNDAGVAPERLVWDFQFGISVRRSGWRVTYAVIRRSDEFDRPTEGKHAFGSISISRSF